MECRNRKQKTDDRNRSSVVCRLPSDLCRLSSVVCPLFIVIVVTLASVCLSQQATVPEKPALIGDANTPGVPAAFPYLAEIVGDDVNALWTRHKLLRLRQTLQRR